MAVRRLGSLFLAVLAMLATTATATVLTSTAGSTAASAATPGPAFTCSTPTYFLSQGTDTASNPTETQLYYSHQDNGSVTYSTLGPAFGHVYNALGFDTTNQYLYATLLGGNTLYQIDSTGGVTSLGAISGYTGAASQPADGAFDASGNYWITGGNGSNKAYEIDVNTSPAAVIGTISLSQPWQPIDYTMIGGELWGVSGSSIYRLNLTNGNVSTFNTPSGVESGDYGAAWTYDNGNLGISDNNDGKIFQIAITNPTGTPTFSLLDSATGPVAGQSNDGADCVAPVPPTADMSITKTGPATVTAGGQVTWSLVVTNNGPDASSGFAVDDAVPSGYTAITANAGCVVSGSSVTCAGGALAKGASTTITITATAPSTYGTCTTNTATVTGDQVDPSAANNSSSAATCTLGKINLVKSASPGSYTAAGQVITYSYLVTNGSTSTMTGITVTDPMPGLSSISCPGTSLAAGASETCTATYTVKAADITAGTVSNTGTAKGTVNGGQVSASSSLTVPYSALTLTKTAVTTGYSASGQTLTYHYVVDDTGDSTISGITVADNKVTPADLTCPYPSLTPGTSETCTGTYTTTAADVTAGSVTNTATASGTDSAGRPITTTTAHATVPGETSSISVTKSTTSAGYSASGQTITYHYLVTNTGTTALGSVVVSDDKVAPADLSCPGSTLAVGASETCTGTYATTQADVDAGSVTNTATASGTDPYGLQVTSAPSSVTVHTSGATSSLSLSKTATSAGFGAAGQTVSYDYLVTNTGTTTISGIAVSDDKVTPADLSCPDPSLAPGDSETCSGTYVTTQADVDAGSVTNTATASGTDPSHRTVDSNVSSATIPANGATASLSLIKSTTSSGYSAAGQSITYDYLVKNTGSVDVSGVTVADDLVAPADLSCPDPTLAPGASETCTGTYTTSQADVDGGSVTNVATATGTAPDSSAVISNQSTVTVRVSGATSSLSLVKSTTSGGYGSSGQTLTYHYLVTNTGTTTIVGIGVDDDLVGSVTCPDSSLAPDASETCTGTYTTTQADVDTGSVTNTATAGGTDPDHGSITSNVSTVTVPASSATSSLSLVKTSTSGGYGSSGQTLSYDYLVTNTGTTTVTGVSVTDDKVAPADLTCPFTTLAPGASEHCDGTYVTTQADVDAGSVTNTATADGTAPDAGTVTSNVSTVTVPADDATSSLSLVKSTTSNGYGAAGQTITYSYLVENTGTTDIDDIGITDNLIGSVNCAIPSLAPGVSEVCNATYTTVQGDVDSGSVTNVATADGTTPSDAPVVSNQSQVTVLASGATSSLSMVKSTTSSGYGASGQTITYGYLVTDTGTTTMDGINIVDDLIPHVSCPDATLSPGASETCTGSYTTTQADVDAGSVTNSAYANGTDPDSNPVDSGFSSVTVPASDATSSLTLVKSATSAGFGAAGQTLSYDYLVTNTGTTTISGISVGDDKVVPADVSCPSSTLAPGASEHCGGTYVTTQADVDAGSVTNTATVSGIAPDSSAITSNPSSATVTADGATSSLSLTKTTTSGGYGAAGDLITYEYAVTNTGTTTVSGIGVTDDLIGSVACPLPTLAPGVSETCTATYAVTQADVDGGSVTNVATADGTNPSHAPVVSNQSQVTVLASGATSSLSLDKSTTSAGYGASDQTIGYRYLVTDTGTTTLSAIGVDDDLIPSVTCPDATLAPGASETCTGSYTTTQADVDAGSVTNSATATGTSPAHDPVDSNPSTVTVPANSATSSLTLVKGTTSAGYGASGQTLSYTYLVTDTGTTTLSGISVADDHVATVTCPDATLAPGASETCTGAYTTTQTDVDAGSVTNLATAHATDPSDDAIVSNPSTVTVPANSTTSSLSLVKSTTSGGYAAAAELLAYQYLVTDTGTTTIYGIGVSDNRIASVTCPLPTLAPGASETCNGTYRTTQADVDAGSVVNTASAHGTDPFSATVTSNPSSVTVDASQGPAISISKTTNGSDGLKIPVGAPVTWSYFVTNSGNVTLTDVVVTDDVVPSSAIDCGVGGNVVASLAPGASVTCTAGGTAAAGSYSNTGTATGTTPGHGTVDDTDTSSYYGVQDLTVAKTATPSFTRTYAWSITKQATPTLVEQVGGGTAPVGYAVAVTQGGHQDSAWKVTGSISVTNPNDFESVQAQVSDVLDNSTCLVAGLGTDVVTVGPGSTQTVGYVCTYPSAPDNPTTDNTATAAWNGVSAGTPDSSATGRAAVDFTTPAPGSPTEVDKCITATDAFDGGPATTLGTDCVGVDPTTKTFTYTRDVAVPSSPPAPVSPPDGIFVSPSTVSYQIAPGSSGTWALALTRWARNTGIAETVGTSGLLSVQVPAVAGCQFQYDVLHNGTRVIGKKITLDGCGEPTCVDYPNTASVAGTGQSASASVEACGAAPTGAERMYFWHGSKGLSVVNHGASVGGVCSSATWLRQYAPFQDLSPTATCAQTSTYVKTTIHAGTGSVRAMLKAQMLGTALDVYFSDPALGGNVIGAPTPLGGVGVDLTKVCQVTDTATTSTCGAVFTNTVTDGLGAFGGAPTLTVSQLLQYASDQSNVGGSIWYGNAGAVQTDAKNTFDSVDIQVVFSP